MTEYPNGAYCVHMATPTYTESVTHTLLVLMRDRGENPTSLARISGVPRKAIDAGLYDGRPWNTAHLEAIANALGVDLLTLVNPVRPGKKVLA